MTRHTKFVGLGYIYSDWVDWNRLARVKLTQDRLTKGKQSWVTLTRVRMRWERLDKVDSDYIDRVRLIRVGLSWMWSLIGFTWNWLTRDMLT